MKKRAILMIVLVLVLLTGCNASDGNGHKSENNNEETEIIMSTDTNAIAKLFPQLTGVESAEWEQITLGDGTSELPGPTDYRYQGYITLTNEAAENYLSSYSWTPDTPDVSFSEIEPKDGNWNYSEDFADAIIPGYYSGSIWIDGNTILFSVTTM